VSEREREREREGRERERGSERACAREYIRSFAETIRAHIDIGIFDTMIATDGAVCLACMTRWPGAAGIQVGA